MIRFDYPDWLSPVIFSLGPVQLTWYALAYMVGLLAGWRIIRWRVLVDKVGLSAQDVDDYLIYALLGVILGGRIGTFLFGWGGGGTWGEQLQLMFWPVQTHADGSWTLAISGMSFHGGFLGVVLATYLFWWRKGRKFSLLGFADYSALVAPIGLFFGRIANFINRELYGRIVDEGAWVGVSFFPNYSLGELWVTACLEGGGALSSCREAFDLAAYRHPSQLYEAVGEGLLLFAVLLLLYRQGWGRQRPGLITGLFIAGYGLVRTLVEYLRSFDPAVGLNALGLTRSQELSLPMILVGLGLMLWALRRGPSA